MSRLGDDNIEPTPLAITWQRALQNVKERRAAKEAEKTQQAEQTQQRLILTKPLTQVIGETSIRWTWRTDVGTVEAFYYTADSVDSDGRVAGDYEIEVHFEACSDTFFWKPGQAKLLATALYSASEWTNLWQQHVGEFLAVKEKPWKDPEPYVFDENGDGQ